MRATSRDAAKANGSRTLLPSTGVRAVRTFGACSRGHSFVAASAGELLKVLEEPGDVERLVVHGVDALGHQAAHDGTQLVPVSRDQDDPGFGVGLADAVEDLGAVAAGEPEVEQNHAGRFAQFHNGPGLVVGDADPEAVLAQQVPQVGAEVRIVEDQHERLPDRVLDQGH